MIDPETARQAVQAWKSWATMTMPTTLGAFEQDVREGVTAGDALAGLVSQLLDQLAELDHRAAKFEAMFDLTNGDRLDAESERDVLGERCRQLTEGLERITNFGKSVPDAVQLIARAALGDTPPNPEPRGIDLSKVRDVPSGTFDTSAFDDVDLVEPPQPETPGYVFGEPNAALRALLYPGETEGT